MPVALMIASSAALASLAMTTLAILGGQTMLDISLNTAQTLIAIAGMAHEMTKVRSGRPIYGEAANGIHTGTPFEPPFEKGLLGGLFGGMVAAPLITLVYYPDMQQYAVMLGGAVELPTFSRVLAEMTVTSAAIGVVLGLLSLTLAEYFEHLRSRHSKVWPFANRLTGAVLGGIAAGLVTGPLASLYFGQLSRPMIEPGTLLLGTLPGAGIIVFSIVNYDHKPLSLETLRNFLKALASTFVIAAFAAAIIATFGPFVLDLLARYIVHAIPSDLFVGGLYYGAFVGAFLGAVVGLTLIISTPVQPLSERA